MTVTTTVPIVFVTGTDPVRDGLVTSFNRPGGNVTGVSFLVSGTSGKRLELLRQLVPTAEVIAVLVDANNVEARAEQRPGSCGEGGRTAAYRVRDQV